MHEVAFMRRRCSCGEQVLSSMISAPLSILKTVLGGTAPLVSRLFIRAGSLLSETRRTREVLEGFRTGEVPGFSKQPEGLVEGSAFRVHGFEGSAFRLQGFKHQAEDFVLKYQRGALPFDYVLFMVLGLGADFGDPRLSRDYRPSIIHSTSPGS